jgi:hypothetical protein
MCDVLRITFGLHVDLQNEKLKDFIEITKMLKDDDITAKLQLISSLIIKLTYFSNNF